MAKNKTGKKYRHGIEAEKNPKVKIKKSDILRRIEVLESLVFSQLPIATNNSVTENNQ